MRVAVVVMPGLFVDVASRLRRDFFKGGFYIVLDKARFVLGGSDSGGRADVEKRCCSGSYAGFSDEPGGLGSDVNDTAVTFCIDLYFFSNDHIR